MHMTAAPTPPAPVPAAVPQWAKNAAEDVHPLLAIYATDKVLEIRISARRELKRSASIIARHARHAPPDQTALLERAERALERIIDEIPAVSPESGAFIFEHYDRDGTYHGMEYANPAISFQTIEAEARAVLAAIKGRTG